MIPNTIKTGKSNTSFAVKHIPQPSSRGSASILSQVYDLPSANRIPVNGQVYVDTKYNSGILILPNQNSDGVQILTGDKIEISGQEDFGTPLSSIRLNEMVSDIGTLNTTKSNINDIVDNVSSSDTNKPLSANQGRVLNTLVNKHLNEIIDIKDNVSTDFTMSSFTSYALFKDTTNTRKIIFPTSPSTNDFIYVYFCSFKDGESWTLYKADGTTTYKAYDKLTYASSYLRFIYDGTDWKEEIIQKSRYSKDGKDIINNTITENKLSTALKAKINSDNDIEIPSTGIATSKTDFPTVVNGKHFGTVNVTGDIPAATQININGTNYYNHTLEQALMAHFTQSNFKRRYI